jgi:putative transposase
MLTTAQFQQWCRRLRLSSETQEHLARLRAAPPVRRVGSRAQNVSGAYTSRKMGCTLQFESHKVELWAIYTMEHDRAVLEYYDQPTTLTLRYRSKTGRQVTVPHTPDFLVLRTDGAVLEEWKPEERLHELVVTQPQRYQRHEHGRWHCPPRRGRGSPPWTPLSRALISRVITHRHSQSDFPGGLLWCV